MDNICPLCGTRGRPWNREPKVFRCPHCSSIFSPYGMVLETENEYLNLWA